MSALNSISFVEMTYGRVLELEGCARTWILNPPSVYQKVPHETSVSYPQVRLVHDMDLDASTSRVDPPSP